MSNEEKILAELKAIRADVEMMKSDIETIKVEGTRREPTPTPEAQLEAFHRLINSITDEEAAEFGRYVDELEREKGGIL